MDLDNLTELMSLEEEYEREILVVRGEQTPPPQNMPLWILAVLSKLLLRTRGLRKNH